LPGQQGRAFVVTEDQSTSDITNEILQAYQDNAKYYDAIQHCFTSATPERLINDLFEWCKKYMRYRVESFELQKVYDLPALLTRAANGGTFDCKNYAGFIVGVSAAKARAGMKINPQYVFASDTSTIRPTHTFAMVNEMWVDPCFSYVNEPHKYKYFKTVSPMALVRISGPATYDQYTIGNIFDDIKRGANVNLQNLKKSVDVNASNVRKAADVNAANAKRAIEVNAANAAKAAKKQFLLGNRNAFLALLKLNVGLWPVKILQYCQTPARLQEWRNAWESLGGDWTAFSKSVNEGYNRWLRKKGRKMPQELHYIAGDPLTVTLAILAAATPVIVALSTLLRKSGADPNNKQVDGGEAPAPGAPAPGSPQPPMPGTQVSLRNFADQAPAGTTFATTYDPSGNPIYTSTYNADRGYLNPVSSLTMSDAANVAPVAPEQGGNWWDENKKTVAEVALGAAVIYGGVKLFQALPAAKKTRK